MSQIIITNNVEEEFKHAKAAAGAKVMRQHTGVTLGRNSIIDKGILPKKVQKKMVFGANANVKMGNPSFYHPLFQTLNMMLPRDRRERNEWCRHFYRTEPIVATALDLHSEFPISDFSHICKDGSIKQFFDYMSFDKLNIIDTLLKIGLEYWKIGDVFPFAQLNEAEGMWESIAILNPDYINIQSSVFANEEIIELIPDEMLKSIVSAGPAGEYGEIYMQLPQDIVEYVKANRNIRLDSRLVSHIAHKAAPYEIWGTPLLYRCFKTLIYKDKLRQAQDAIATRHITPLRVAKIGQPGEPMPSQEDIDGLRDLLMEADMDPNFFLVYHYGLQFEYVGSSGSILPLNQEFEFIQKELMNGLCINEAMLNGDGPTYATAQVGFDTLARRYMSYRLRLEQWIKNNIYKPIAEIQGFYQPNPKELIGGYRVANKKEKQLIIPDINWNQQDLTGNQAVMSMIQQLQQNNQVSCHTILPMLNLDPEVEKLNLEKERGTVFDPNAPKTGPLPNSEGETILPGGPEPPAAPPENPTVETSLNSNFFERSGESEKQQIPRKIMRIKHQNISSSTNPGEN